MSKQLRELQARKAGLIKEARALTDRAASEEETRAIEQEILATPGVLGIHDLRTRRTGDMILVDVHLEVDGNLSVRQGHEIAEEVHRRVEQRHPVLNVLTHLDPV